MIALLYDKSTTNIDNKFIRNLNTEFFYKNPTEASLEYKNEDLSLRDLVAGDLAEMIKLSYYVRYEGSVTY